GLLKDVFHWGEEMALLVAHMRFEHEEQMDHAFGDFAVAGRQLALDDTFELGGGGFKTAMLQLDLRVRVPQFRAPTEDEGVERLALATFVHFEVRDQGFHETQDRFSRFGTATL